MANDLNCVMLIGRLGRDPETRYLPNGDAVTSFSIAVGESWKDKNSGEKQESTEWVHCVTWRQMGEICGHYLKKSQQVFVQGKMKTRKWQDKDGQDRYTTEVILDKMQMLGGKPAEQGEQRPARQERQPTVKSPPPDMDDDIPF